MASYLFNLGVAVDQLASAILGGAPDETLSSRFGKAQREGKKWACVICRILDIFDPGHCEWSIERDEGRKRIWEWYDGKSQD